MRGRESVRGESIAITGRWCRPEGGIDVGSSEDERRWCEFTGVGRMRGRQRVVKGSTTIGGRWRKPMGGIDVESNEDEDNNMGLQV